jgi:hypothetical protein
MAVNERLPVRERWTAMGKDESARSSVINPVSLARGTMVTSDIGRMRDFLENFFGFECADGLGGNLIVREGGHGTGGRYNAEPYWVLDIAQVDAIAKPQAMLNHWGTFVDSMEKVDQAYAAAVAAKERFGLRKVMKPREQHWAYSFYIEGFDSNWWEVEYRSPQASYEAVRARGDMV